MFGVLAALFNNENRIAEIIVGNKRIFLGRIFTIHFGNMPTTRGGIPVTPIAKLSDGKIDMLLAKGITRLEGLKTLPKVLKGEHLSRPAVIYGQFHEVRVLMERNHIAVDGEYLGMTNKVEISFVKKLRFLASR
ncbi:MAG: diacylglycerol kinase family protein [Candidatus Njordarchaeum guaymaensis]